MLRIAARVVRRSLGLGLFSMAVYLVYLLTLGGWNVRSGPDPWVYLGILLTGGGGMGFGLLLWSAVEFGRWLLARRGRVRAIG